MKRTVLLGAVVGMRVVEAGAAQIEPYSTVGGERSGHGQATVVIRNTSSKPIGISIDKVKLSDSSTAVCARTVAAREQKGPALFSWDTTGLSYVSDAPPGSWVHRQLTVPGKFLDIGCSLSIEFVVDSDGENLRTWTKIALDTKVATGIDIPFPKELPPYAVAISQEYNLTESIHLVHVVFRSQAATVQEGALEARGSCTRGRLRMSFSEETELRPIAKAILPQSAAGRWGAVVLFARKDQADGTCKVDFTLAPRTAGQAAKSRVISIQLTNEHPFVPDRPIE